MPISAPKSGASLADIVFADGRMTLKFVDGRELTVPLALFRRLANATEAQLKHWRIIGPGIGISSPQLGEDLSIAKLLDPRPVGRLRRVPR